MLFSPSDYFFSSLMSYFILLSALPSQWQKQFISKNTQTKLKQILGDKTSVFCPVVGCSEKKQFSSGWRRAVHELVHTVRFYCACLSVYLSEDALRVHLRDYKCSSQKKRTPYVVDAESFPAFKQFMVETGGVEPSDRVEKLSYGQRLENSHIRFYTPAKESESTSFVPAFSPPSTPTELEPIADQLPDVLPGVNVAEEIPSLRTGCKRELDVEPSMVLFDSTTVKQPRVSEDCPFTSTAGSSSTAPSSQSSEWQRLLNTDSMVPLPSFAPDPMKRNDATLVLSNPRTAVPHTALPHTAHAHTALPHTALPHTSLPHTSLAHTVGSDETARPALLYDRIRQLHSHIQSCNHIMAQLLQGKGTEERFHAAMAQLLFYQFQSKKPRYLNLDDLPNNTHEPC